MLRIYALSDGGFIRVQMAHGELSKHGNIIASCLIDPDQAQTLIERLQQAIAEVPRVGTPADLGCEVL